MKKKESTEVDNDWERTNAAMMMENDTICCKGLARTIEKERGEDKRNKKM